MLTAHRTLKEPQSEHEGIITMAQARYSRTLRWVGHRLVLSGALALAAGSAGAINADSPFQDWLVDASLGEFDDGEAGRIQSRLNELDLSQYTLVFSEGASVKLDNADALDQTLADYEERGLELTGLAGPDGTLLFGSEEVACARGSGVATPDFESNALAATENCLGIRTFQESPQAQVASARAQANTVDLFISRPTSQFMMDIRRFEPVRQHLHSVAGTSPGTGTGTDGDRPEGGGSGDGDTLFNGPWGVYFNGGGSFGKIDSTAQSTGFGVHTQFGTGGFDYRFSDRVAAGFLFNFSGATTTFNQGSGDLDADIYRFMPFATVTPFENAYIDILAGYAYQTYDSRRNSSGTLATANYSADQALAAINLGYSVPLGALEITGFAGGSYIDTEVGGYTEKGTGLKIGSYQVSSWTSTVGMEFAYTYSVPFGVLIPHLRLEWTHEFANDQRSVSVFVPAQGSFSLPTGNPIRDWGKVMAGVQTLLPGGMTGFVNYEAQIMSGGENHMVEGGLRLEF
jgi:uncharacterized protein with beta-barrel porin domain